MTTSTSRLATGTTTEQRDAYRDAYRRLRKAGFSFGVSADHAGRWHWATHHNRRIQVLLIVEGLHPTVDGPIALRRRFANGIEQTYAYPLAEAEFAIEYAITAAADKTFPAVTR